MQATFFNVLSLSSSIKSAIKEKLLNMGQPVVRQVDQVLRRVISMNSDNRRGSENGKEAFNQLLKRHIPSEKKNALKELTEPMSQLLETVIKCTQEILKTRDAQTTRLFLE